MMKRKLIGALVGAAVMSLAAGQACDKQAMAAAADPALPPAILNRPKTGFFVPVSQWLGESSLKGWARRVYRSFVGDGTAREGR